MISRSYEPLTQSLGASQRGPTEGRLSLLQFRVARRCGASTSATCCALRLSTFTMSEPVKTPGTTRALPNLIFASRWLQLPLYIGLIGAQAVYVFQFWVELVHLIEAAFGNQTALATLVKSSGYQAAAILGPDGKVIGYEAITHLNETIIMLVVLALIDVVMISNLLIMVIVGGYETFVSRMHLESHPDQPEWLSHVNASVLKVKLATAIIGISSIHLLKTFINAANYDEKVLIWQTVIHFVFLLSALAIALADRIMHPVAEVADH